MASVSVDIVPAPLILFKTRTNTELGAASVSFEDDGTVVFSAVSKKVTEGMLTSYPRSVLGEWTPNRIALRYPAEEIADRKVRKFDSGEPLDAEALKQLAS
ncbi:MAG: hypothetical protein AAF430_19480 [Myxococcota bacterium]